MFPKAMLLLYLCCINGQELTTSVQTKEGGCYFSWIQFNNYCYKLYDTAGTWYTANKTCVDDGANLASVHNVEENQFLFNFKRYLWIGTNKISGSITNSDGTPYDYPMGQFSNGAGENCVWIGWYSFPFWDDVPCDKNLSFVCKTASASLVFNVSVKFTADYYNFKYSEPIVAGATGAAGSLGFYFIWSWISKIPAVSNFLQRVHRFIFEIPTDSERIETILETVENVVHLIEAQNDSETTSIVELDLR
jgi:hypothetical protein